MPRPLPTLLLVACVSTEDTGRQPIPVDERPPLDQDADDSDADSGSEDDSAEEEPDEPDPAESCHPDLQGWPARWAEYEEQVLELVNQERAEGADCGAYGSFPPTGPLTMNPHLRCAARYHSLWMAETGIFAHESPGGDLGDDVWERVASTEFTGSTIGENIAAGYGTPADAVAGWMDSDGHCANIMSGAARLIGVGYVQGGSYGSYWTQDFGA